jgi:GNAT superfamily N-acetyltransferase
MVTICRLEDSALKSGISDTILRALPEWFGIESSIIEYVEGVVPSKFYVAHHEDAPVGFLSITTHNIHTSEIYVMGILEPFHRQGVGRLLLNAAEDDLRKENVRFLMVKTLGSSHPDVHYARTREFYAHSGFYPLEEIPEVWGPANPCLIMVKAL